MPLKKTGLGLWFSVLTGFDKRQKVTLSTLKAALGTQNYRDTKELFKRRAAKYHTMESA